MTGKPTGVGEALPRPAVLPPVPLVVWNRAYDSIGRIDAARLAARRHTIFGEPVPDLPPAPADRVAYAELRTAARLDPTAFWAF